MEFQKITVCLDMCGCPNRCRHCWLGVTPNGNLREADLNDVARAFRPYTGNLEVFDWYREPDYAPDYRERWELRCRLSDTVTPHYENISIWRAVRDAEYIPWVASLGVKAAQLTLFGNEETTDWFFGRKGVYREILETIELLLQNGIMPRIQTFLYKTNVDQLPHIQRLIEELELEERCRAAGGRFDFFLHQGSCDGENEKLYDVWITPDDLPHIPRRLLEYTLLYWNASRLEEVVGFPEKELYERLLEDDSTEELAQAEPVFFVDKDFDVYPNYETPSAAYCLGNLRLDGAERILERYRLNLSPAQHIRATVPMKDMVKACGNPESMRLFTEWDYKNLIHSRFCREKT